MSGFEFHRLQGFLFLMVCVTLRAARTLFTLGILLGVSYLYDFPKEFCYCLRIMLIYSALQNGSKCVVKWAVLGCEMGRFAA